MLMTYLSENEFEALRGLPHEARSLYLLIRSRADKNSIAGKKYKLSEPMMREWMEVPPVQGSRRGYVAYSRQQVRSTIDCLVRNGLITRIGTFVFRLNLAMRTTPSEIRATDEQPFEKHLCATTSKSIQPTVKKGKITTAKPDEQPMSNQPLIGEEQPTSLITNKKKSKRDDNTSLVKFDKTDSEFLFEHWKKLMNHPRAKLDDKRKRIITNAMKIGYSRDDLTLAIDGCGKSDWHMGNNDKGKVFDALTLIFRDADHIDNFISIANTGGTKASFANKSSLVVSEFLDKKEIIQAGGVSYG